MKTDKTNNHVSGLSDGTVRYHLNNGVYYYLYISKPEWQNLIDKNGRALKQPPVWQHGSTVNFPSRLNDHNKHLEVLTDDQLSRSVIQKYIRQNNMVLSADYYLDISVLDFSRLFWCFELEHGINRHDAVSYKNALEAVMKHSMNEWFIVDGKPLLSRFANVWTGECINHSIEKITAPSKATIEKASELLDFMARLSKNETAKKIVDDAMKVRTVAETLQRVKHNYAFRNQQLDKQESEQESDRSSHSLNKYIITKETVIY